MLRDLVMKNRSYRGFDASRSVTKEQLLSLVECARLCPSSVNIQPLKYFLAWDKDTVNKIQPLTSWARGLPHIQLPHPGHCPTAFIVICQDKTIAPDTLRFQKDVGIAAQTMLLAAVEMDLGGCMIGNFNPEQIQQKLNLAQDIVPMLILAIGYPDETVVITQAEGNKTAYYRDEKDVHYVPKRKLEDIIL